MPAIAPSTVSERTAHLVRSVLRPAGPGRTASLLPANRSSHSARTNHSLVSRPGRDLYSAAMEELRLDVASDEIEETPIRLSYSSISTYELCPLQYKFRYIDKRPERRTPALGFGESLHEALRR